MEGALSYDQEAIAEAFSNHLSFIFDAVNNDNAYNKTRTNKEMCATYNYVHYIMHMYIKYIHDELINL
jgi:hypothetical protein